jgi:hypothetical protein
MLYYYDAPPGRVSHPAPARRILPLMSVGADENGRLLAEVPLEEKGNALGGEAWNDENSVDLNRPRFNGDTAGWIGSPPPPKGASGEVDNRADKPKAFRAKWIELKEQSTSGSQPKTFARYAFWIEDESFKLNLNLLGAQPRSAEKDSAGQSPAEIPIQGLLRSARAPFPSDAERDSFARDVVQLRDGFFGRRMLEMRGFNRAHGSYNLGDEAKFLATLFSASHNVSRHGSQRLNVNGLGFDVMTTSSAPADGEIMQGVSRLVEAIRFHAPKFGERFYHDVAEEKVTPIVLNAEQVTPAHRNIYLHKLAANLRDYIDIDFQPTILDRSGKLWPRRAPVTAMSAREGENEAWAQGKDSAPFLQEAVARLRGGPIGSGRYQLSVDYYLEFWNMTGRDITASELGTKPFVRISNPPGWREQRNSGQGRLLLADNSPPGKPEEGRMLTIYLQSNATGSVRRNGVSVPEVVFKAGASTVITTDPDVAGAKRMESLQGGTDSETTYFSANIVGKREFAGPLEAGAIGIIMQFGRDTVSTDYRTEVLFGNDEGYLDSHPAAVAYLTRAGLKAAGGEQVHGGSLLGNGLAPSQLGDPRTNNEQLNIAIFRSGGIDSEPDQTRYANPLSKYPRFSLGRPNSVFVFPHEGYQWKDYYKGWERTGEGTEPAPNPLPTSAPAVVANRRLKSIGELGHLFDPARVKSGKGQLGKIEGARGGGRTLKIGQPDDLISLETVNAATTDFPLGPSAVNRSREWASWRLCDFLSSSGDLNLTGQININGVRRDNGAALRAACDGMTLQTVARGPKDSTALSGDLPLSSEEDAAVGLQQVITQAIERMNANEPGPNYDPSKAYFGPFAERGELSELPIFNNREQHTEVTRSLINDLSGRPVNMADAMDRSREELFRRLVEMTTTRGSIFSVYVVGQSIAQNAASGVQRVTGTHRTKVTFQLVPRNSDGSPFGSARNIDGTPKPESFDPAKPAERFSKPHHYDIQILHVGG